jgi:glycosyltransferase involved in cell wall biosynthesis
MTTVTFCAYDKPNNLGGPLTWLSQLLPGLRAHGIESRCLFLTHWGDTGPYIEKLRASGFDCRQEACHYHTRDRIQWMLSQLQETPPDVFVPNLVVAGYYAGRWVRSAGIPTVGILHSDDAFYRGIQDEFVFGRKEYRLSALACVSSELERQVNARQPLVTEVRRISYGVEVPQRKAERSPGRLRLAYVGRLAQEQKQISEVTRALCRVTSALSGTEAVLYGDGPDRAAVEAILAGEGCSSGVTLAGRVPGELMQSRLLDCDVLVLLSDYEGLPIAVLEAMACGVVPVCLQMRSGIPELVEDGVTGLVVRDRQEGLLEAIRRLQSEAGLWERLSRAARDRIARDYSQASSVELWADLLFQLHAKAQARRLISTPTKLTLPPVNPALASADPRPSGPSLTMRLYRSGRMFAGRIRRRLRGQQAS